MPDEVLTPERIIEERMEVLESARRFLGTPYHHMGRVPGAGVDCLTFLAESFMRAHIVPHIDIPFYPHDWHLHRDAQRYMDGLLQYCSEVGSVEEREPQPADIILYQFGRTFSHGVLVESWPAVLHAFLQEGVVRTDAVREKRLVMVGESGLLKGSVRPRRVFCLNRWIL